MSKTVAEVIKNLQHLIKELEQMPQDKEVWLCENCDMEECVYIKEFDVVQIM